MSGKITKREPSGTFPNYSQETIDGTWLISTKLVVSAMTQTEGCISITHSLSPAR